MLENKEAVGGRVTELILLVQEELNTSVHSVIEK